MMWKTKQSGPAFKRLEPLEVRWLKQQLVNVNCNCDVCTGNNDIYKHGGSFGNNKEMQSEEESNNSRSICQLGHYNDKYIDKANSNIIMCTSTPKDTLCSACDIIMQLLQAGATKVLKDEELETNVEIFRCDKSVGRIVNFVEKATSVTDEPTLKFYNELFSERSSDTSDLKRSSIRKRNICEKVTFLDDQKESEEKTEQDNGSLDENKACTKLHENCFCLESFINAIRPPFQDVLDENYFTSY